MFLNRHRQLLENLLNFLREFVFLYSTMKGKETSNEFLPLPDVILRPGAWLLHKGNSPVPCGMRSMDSLVKGHIAAVGCLGWFKLVWFVLNIAFYLKVHFT